ncbi:MAG: inositol monophosphatase family protein [Pseudomonadota bacterium]
MHPMLNIATRAARAAGNIIMRNLDRIDSLSIESKQRNDFVSEVDRAAEATIIDTLHQAYPDHAIMAEESGNTGNSEYVWIIDPLDGTTNFLHGFPQFAVSIALKKGSALEQGVIYDPVKQELFTASRGRGAWLDNKRLRVSKRRTLQTSLIGTGLPYLDNQDIDQYLPVLRDFIKCTSGIRRPGAAALDLAYVAAGRLDGFWEAGLNVWDVAAGGLLIREAGGLIGDFNGGEDWLEGEQIVAANPKIFHAMLQVIKPHCSVKD